MGLTAIVSYVVEEGATHIPTPDLVENQTLSLPRSPCSFIYSQPQQPTKLRVLVLVPKKAHQPAT